PRPRFGQAPLRSPQTNPRAPMPAPRFGVYAGVMALTSLVADSDAAPPSGYLKPPQAIRDVLDAPPPPAVSVSPTRGHVLLLHTIRYPALADAASPMLRLAGLRINPRTNGPHLPPLIHGLTLEWLPDSRTLLCHTIPADRGPPPAPPAVPPGPNVQESSGPAGPVRTYQDLLQTPHDEALFDFYATSQLTFVDVQAGTVRPFGP